MKNCIASVLSKVSSKIQAEIVIVNNDAQEDLSEIEKNFSQVTIIKNFSNEGPGAGWNQGRMNAKGEVILFLNPDTEIISDNIKDVLEEFEMDNALGILGAGLVGTDDRNQSWSAGKEISLGDTILNNIGIVRSKSIWDGGKKTEVGWVSGASLFARRDFLDEIGGFDENIFLYFEDADLCRRARLAGKKIFYYPDFKIKHFGGGSYSDRNKQKNDFYKSQEYYYKKHLGIFQLAALKILRKIFVGR